MLRVSVSQSSLQIDLSGLRTGDSQALDAVPNASTLIRLADAFMKHEPDHLANIRDEAASVIGELGVIEACLLYTSPSPRDLSTSRMPSSA